MPYPWDWKTKELIVKIQEPGLILYEINTLDDPRVLDPVYSPESVPVIEKIKNIYKKVIKYPAIQLTPVFVEFIIRQEIKKLPRIEQEEIGKYLLLTAAGIGIIAAATIVGTGGTAAVPAIIPTIFATAAFVVSYEILTNTSVSGGS